MNCLHVQRLMSRYTCMTVGVGVCVHACRCDCEYKCGCGCCVGVCMFVDVSVSVCMCGYVCVGVWVCVGVDGCVDVWVLCMALQCMLVNVSVIVSVGWVCRCVGIGVLGFTMCV